jgi:phosphoglycolate phosphatase-like HAD superfamily hydrolase
LVASDYDGTQFQTLEPEPGNITVNRAYELAVQKVLGPYALKKYRAGGGHLNRTPSEIVESLIGVSNGPLLEKAIELSRQGATKQQLLQYIGEVGHDRPKILGWLDIFGDDLDLVSGLVVEAKLEPLMSQIGKKISGGYWPRPLPGFLKFSSTVQSLREQGVAINTAVVSAGHSVFINKTYELYDVAPPDILITDESIQAANKHLTATRRAKPSPFPMVLAKIEWLRLYSEPPTKLRDAEQVQDINSRIVYIGDDNVKDAGLAANAHVDFVLVNPANPQASYTDLLGRLPLSWLASIEEGKA